MNRRILAVALAIALFAIIGASLAPLFLTPPVPQCPYLSTPVRFTKIDSRPVQVRRCHIPDDCIDSKRYPLFMARAVLKELIESLQSTQGVKPC